MSEHNIKWYEDDNLTIFFSEAPKVSVRYIVPSMTSLEKQSIKRYPFINKKDLKVAIFDSKKEKCYKFTIHKDYVFDGATIPRFFWRIIGSPTDNNFLISSLCHDVLCENHSYIDNDRQLSSNVFRALLIAAGVSGLKANIMFFAVDNFQRFCGWERDKQSKKVS